MKNLHQIFLAVALFLGSLVSMAQTPVYNSYPSAPAVIYLDFDGQTVNGTAWNTSGPIVCGPSNMTTDQITEIFNRISEDYRPFNVNITTDSTRYLNAPAYSRMRVIFTVTSDWYGNTAGGVAYIGSFIWGDKTPCFIFTQLLGFSTKNVAEAGAHEAGHTLGLKHQSKYDANCVKTSEYNSGTGTGEIGWAPIMGVGYNRNMTLWNNGANPFGCNVIQDDLGMITSGVNGFTYRTDDHTNNTGTATVANFAGNQFSVSGVIERSADQDLFKFTVPATSSLHIEALPYNVGTSNSGSDLDIQVEMTTQNGTVIGTYNPNLLLNATIDTVLTAGDYFLRVKAMGNIYAPQYASLGSYSLMGTMTVATPLPLRSLILSGQAQGAQHLLHWVIDADEAVVEQSLEISTNGRDFQKVSGFTPGTRQYGYGAPANAVSYYRMNVVFDNGHQYYSNTIAIRSQAAAGGPHILQNPVRDQLSISSPSACTYLVADLNGRVVKKGELAQGITVISSVDLPSGMYVIRYINGQEQSAEKFIKQ
jgi:hypothetical protein